MDWAALLYLIPYVVSLGISGAVGAYALRRRREPEAAAYAVVALSQASWTLGYLFELLSPDVEGKLFLDNFQFLGGGGWAIGFAAFSLLFTGRRIPRPRLTLGLLAFLGLTFMALVYTNPLHNLISAQPRLIAARPFSALDYDIGPVFWAYTVLWLVTFVACTGLLVDRFIRSQRLHRAQMALVLTGNLIPVLGAIATLTILVDQPFRDISPFTFAAGNLVVAWALFRYRLLEVLPVARDVIFESIQDPVFVFDSQRRLVDLNPAARDALGPAALQAVGQTADQVFAAWPDLLDKYRGIERLEQTEIEVDTLAGRRAIELRLQPLQNRPGRVVGYLAISRDITDRKAAEETLRQHSAQLEEANERLVMLSRAKDDFVSHVTHELRTPVVIAKLTLRLLELDTSNRDQHMKTLRLEIERFEAMIDSLLALSRIDQGRVILESKPVDLNALAEQVVAEWSPLAGDRGLALGLDGGQPLPDVTIDPGLIRQALGILLTNAINYTPSGGQVRVFTRLKDSKGQRRVGIGVSDTGPGIEPEEQAKVFARFFRGSAGRKSGIAGAGLGLALAREIVERFHGFIEVASEGEPGKGAEFTLWLPVEEE